MPLEVRGQSHNALAITGGRHFQHFRQLALGTLGTTPAQVALTTLGAHDLAGTGHPEPLGCGFVRLDLVLLLLLQVADEDVGEGTGDLDVRLQPPAPFVGHLPQGREPVRGV